MADTKITALSALTAADPANDVLPIVDVNDPFMAASGTTKKISINNILGASGTATLASATITGDLTVDTNTLKVDSANNRVGIQVASPSDTLDIGANDGTAKSIALRYSTLPLFLSSTFDGINGINTLSINNKNTSTGSASWASAINTTYGSSAIQTLSYIGGGEVRMFTSSSSNAVPSERYRIDNTGVSTWSVGGSTAMTLNSTGLGVGGSPVSGMLLTVGSTSSVSATATAFQILSNKGTFNIVTNGATNAAGTTITYSWANDGQGPLIFRNSTISNVMTLDASGNVISNVTGTAPTLATNSQMVFNLTSNTNLRISVRGTDGTTRTANITLA